MTQQRTEGNDSYPRDSYPRRAALTRHFRSGTPRLFTLAPDGKRVLFLRSTSGTDSVDSLIHLTLTRDGESTEEIVIDPRDLLDPTTMDLDPAERSRRERMRETSTGVASYDADAAMTVVCVTLGGQLLVARLDSHGASIQQLETGGGVIDPRISPSGEYVTYVAHRSVHVINSDGTGGRILCSPEVDTQSFGMADFIAAEELSRSRGHWWAPDSSSLIVEEFDDSAVSQWWISDPTSPDQRPSQHRYPRAGTANPAVRLWLVRLDGERRDIEWDHERFPYLVAVSWSELGDPLITVLSRDQRTQRIFSFDPVGHASVVVAEDVDECWVETAPGLPCRGPAGLVARLVDDIEHDTRRIVIGDLSSPVGLQVRSVLESDNEGLLIAASTDATQSSLYSMDWSGHIKRLSESPGWQLGRRASGNLLVVSHSLDRAGTRAEVRRDESIVEITSRADVPPLDINPVLLRVGDRELNTAVLFPAEGQPGQLPVVMCPYGGPHVVEVIAAKSAYADAQWLANQGFVVIVADGRGTPGRGPRWERAIKGDLATAVLEDQVAALHGVAKYFPDRLDLTRVGITGWSFGGYLAALAVLRRPEVFHVAVAGAPVTDWRLYDTCYTERYLGHPDESPANYDESSLLKLAPSLKRPLMLIHGLADDNVVAAHSLRLSAELTAAGRPHTLLPLSGVTHMTPQVEVAENLMLLQLDFFRTHLGTQATTAD